MLNNTKTASRSRWTFWNVILRKPIKFAALLIFMTRFLVGKLDMVVTYIVRDMLGMTTLPDFMIVALLIATFLAAVVLSGVVLMAASNLRLAAMKPEEAEKLFEQQSHFFWSKLYSLVIGYFAWYAMILLAERMGGSYSGGFLETLVLLIVPLLLANLLARALNKIMIRLTGTNKELIEGFKAGLYNDQVPAKCRNAEDMNGILRTLENAEAGSVRMAVVVYRVKKAVARFVKKFLKDAGKAMLIGAAIGAVLGMGMSNMIQNEIDDQMADWRRQRREEDAQRKFDNSVGSAVDYALKKRGL